MSVRETEGSIPRSVRQKIIAVVGCGLLAIAAQWRLNVLQIGVDPILNVLDVVEVADSQTPVVEAALLPRTVGAARPISAVPRTVYGAELLHGGVVAQRRLPLGLVEVTHRLSVFPHDVIFLVHDTTEHISFFLSFEASSIAKPLSVQSHAGLGDVRWERQHRRQALLH